MEKLGPGQALGAMCSFWEAYINTGWDSEGKEGVVGCGGRVVVVEIKKTKKRKQPLPG